MTTTHTLTQTPLESMTDAELRAEHARREASFIAARAANLSSHDVTELDHAVMEVELVMQARTSEREDAMANEPPLDMPPADPFDVFASRIMRGDVGAAVGLGLAVTHSARLAMAGHYRSAR